jgi:hypothetical protein
LEDDPDLDPNQSIQNLDLMNKIAAYLNSLKQAQI